MLHLDCLNRWQTKRKANLEIQREVAEQAKAEEEEQSLVPAAMAAAMAAAEVTKSDSAFRPSASPRLAVRPKLRSVSQHCALSLDDHFEHAYMCLLQAWADCEVIERLRDWQQQRDSLLEHARSESEADAARQLDFSPRLPAATSRHAAVARARHAIGSRKIQAISD